MNENKERDAFEAWRAGCGYNTEGYWGVIWQAWQACAAHSAEAQQMSEPDGYGETDFGYTFAGIALEDGDRRLMTMLVRALGTDHPAIDDMTALLFRARAAAPVAASQPSKLDADLLETIRQAAKTRAEGAITKDGRAVFINYGDGEQQMIDGSAMACPCCGGSGHKDDVPGYIQQIIADRLSPPVGTYKQSAEPVAWMMKHRVGSDRGLSWKADNPNFSDEWQRIPLYAATGAQPMQLPESMSRDEVLAYYSQYANVQANEALQYQKRIRELEASLAATGTQVDTSHKALNLAETLQDIGHKFGCPAGVKITDWLRVRLAQAAQSAIPTAQEYSGFQNMAVCEDWIAGWNACREYRGAPSASPAALTDAAKLACAAKEALHGLGNKLNHAEANDEWCEQAKAPFITRGIAAIDALASLAASPAPTSTRASVEARQRAAMQAQFANRQSSPATADFDLPEPNDAVPAAMGQVPEGYGETDFGYTFAGITLEDGDKRLMAMLVKALGTDHPAVDDMAALLFRSRSATLPATGADDARDAARYRAIRQGSTGKFRNDLETWMCPQGLDQYADELVAIAAMERASKEGDSNG